MSELVRIVSRTIAYPLEEVWAALQRTADLSIVDGWQTVQRTSDSEWVAEFQGKRMPCKTVFDEAAHRADVSMRNPMKRFSHDTATIEAVETEAGTQVTVTMIIRGGPMTMIMTKLTGTAATDRIADNVISNIEAICADEEPHDIPSDEILDFARKRVEELHQELGGKEGETPARKGLEAGD